VFASGNGTNFRSIIEHKRKGQIESDVELLITNNSTCGAAEIARAEGIEVVHISRKVFPDLSSLDYSNLFISALKKYDIDLIVLAGYMKMLPEEVVKKYSNRIINIHPALLPNYGGKGMYGLNVHKAVIESGDKETGATVHFVNESYDEGKIIYQEKIPVNENDTPESLMEKVREAEHRIFPKVISQLEKELTTKTNR
jgi:phosphoribosylglycinamide formyltransferase-1